MQKLKLSALVSLLLVISMLFAACAGTPAAPATDSSQEPAAEPSSEPAAEPTQAPSAEPFRVAIVEPYTLDALPWLVKMVADLTAYDQAHDELEIKFVEAVDANQYEPTLRSLADEGYDMIIAAFNNFTDALARVAADYPEIKFAGHESRFTDIETHPNIFEFQDTKELHFLSGATAGFMTKNNKVAMLMGADIAAEQEILACWEKGYKNTNPNGEYAPVVMNSWEDAQLGYETAISLIDKGYDVLFSSCGGADEGVIRACAERGVYYVAEAASYENGDYGSAELCSNEGDFAAEYLIAVNDAMNNQFRGGVAYKCVAADNVAIFKFSANTAVPQDIQDKVLAIKDQIINGEITFDLVPLP